MAKSAIFPGMQPLNETLRERPLLFDGAMGSQLYQRGVFLNRAFDGINLSDPSLVLSVHRDYIGAGAQVLTTNTYGANRVRLARHGLADKVEAINREGVIVARRAGRSGAVYVLGAMGPTGAGSIAHLEEGRSVILDALAEQVRALAAAAPDGVVLETYTHLDEILIALQACAQEAPDLPVLAQMRFGRDRLLEDGTPASEVAERLAAAGADIIGVNCGDGPQLVFDVAREMVEASELPIVAQPNAGSPQDVDGRAIYVTNPEYFGVFARRLLKAGVRGVGGCCGTSPSHIRQMSGAVRMMSGGRVRLAGGDAPAERPLPTPRPTAPMASRSKLGARLAAGEFSVSVEVNPPAGLSPSARIESAKMLIGAGADVINTSDGPRASCRMSNLTMADLMQREIGCETILHVCCRDRSLLGLVSHLMAAHVTGIRNLVVITGDPPKMGDFPDSTAIYDVDSVGLLEIASGMNAGIDPAGKIMEASTSFVLATGAEPAALDYDRELRRLEDKKAAGADFVMTQPVYEQATLDRFLSDVQSINLPVLVGILPLASHGNAEFLHHEVPGMRVPAAVRERMRGAGKGKSARAEGVAIATEMVALVRDRVAGIYVMPPLGRYGSAVRILEALGR
jgi:homocysteine S-methyltransferase